MKSVVVSLGALGLLLLGCGGGGGSDFRLPASNGAIGASGSTPGSIQPIKAPLRAVRATEAVPNDADDPSIWVHPTDPAKSLIIGTDKHEETGGLYVFDLSGKTVQKITPLDRPNNVDVIQGVEIGGKKLDLAATTERKKEQVRIYTISSEGKLEEVTGNTKFLPSSTGEEKAPMGITLWQNPKDSSVHAFVSPKTGPKTGYVAQYQLAAGKEGKIDLKFVRRLGSFSGMDKEGNGEIEALEIDPKKGDLYFADELQAIKRMPADPASKAGEFSFGRGDYKGDREGLAVAEWEGVNYLFSTDQIENASRIFVYDITGRLPKRVGILDTPSDTTDGIEVKAVPLGPEFPEGILVMMNSKDKNFLLFDLREVKRSLQANRR